MNNEEKCSKFCWGGSMDKCQLYCTLPELKLLLISEEATFIAAVPRHMKHWESLLEEMAKDRSMVNSQRGIRRYSSVRRGIQVLMVIYLFAY